MWEAFLEGGPWNRVGGGRRWEVAVRDMVVGRRGRFEVDGGEVSEDWPGMSRWEC